MSNSIILIFAFKMLVTVVLLVVISVSFFKGRKDHYDFMDEMVDYWVKNGLDVPGWMHKYEKRYYKRRNN